MEPRFLFYLRFNPVPQFISRGGYKLVYASGSESGLW